MSEENNNGGGEHWSQGFASESITDENRGAFVSANSKYATEQDAIMGGYNAQKAMGKPFKMPENMDSLDEVSRGEFATQANTLLGRTMAKNVDAFADSNFNEGLAEGTASDENVVSMVKQWAVDEGVSVESTMKMAKLFNGPLSQYAMQAHADKAEADHLAAAKACNEALIADPDFGSLEKVTEQSELFKRGVMGMCKKNGLSADDAEGIAESMVRGGLTSDPRLAKMMLQAFAPMAAEGSTLGGDGFNNGGNQGPTPYQWKKAKFPATPGEWGDPSDKWDDESKQLRQVAGIK